MKYLIQIQRALLCFLIIKPGLLLRIYFLFVADYFFDMFFFLFTGLFCFVSLFFCLFVLFCLRGEGALQLNYINQNW